MSGLCFSLLKLLLTNRLHFMPERSLPGQFCLLKLSFSLFNLFRPQKQLHLLQHFFDLEVLPQQSVSIRMSKWLLQRWRIDLSELCESLLSLFCRE